MDEQNKLDELRKRALAKIAEAHSTEDVSDVRNNFLSKRSELMSLMATLGSLPAEQRKEFGQKINQVRTIITEAIDRKQAEIKQVEMKKRLEKEAIDISLPARDAHVGAKNPFFIIRDEIIDIFVGMGYEIGDGPEVELDHYNFELLNIPKDHPARDMQDTLYINENVLLRTHTSPVQARTMEAKAGKPIKIICPGKVYRRDDDDATHSHQFAQVEGLVIDKNINLGHLKATLDLFAKKMFGEKREIRLRPSFFPFTEPSVEVDITCANCGGKGCSICKGTGYIEILGGGMVHPHVLEMNGYDPNVYSGFAFGIGIERVAMLRYGVDDIRKFYTDDVRFLHQFKEKI